VEVGGDLESTVIQVINKPELVMLINFLAAMSLFHK